MPNYTVFYELQLSVFEAGTPEDAVAAASIAIQSKLTREELVKRLKYQTCVEDRQQNLFEVKHG